MQGRRFEGGGGGDRIAPVKVGAELDVRIEGVGEKGDGIAKVQGFVLFVPGVRTGDEVRIKVTRVLAKVGFAEVIGRKEKSDEEQDQTEEYPDEPESEPEEESDEPSEEGDEDDSLESGEYEDSENF